VRTRWGVGISAGITSLIAATAMPALGASEPGSVSPKEQAHRADLANAIVGVSRVHVGAALFESVQISDLVKALRWSHVNPHHVVRKPTAKILISV
jgi:hypothetical protein